MLQASLFRQAIRGKSLGQFIGDIAVQQKQLVHALHRFRYRDRIGQVTESDLHRVRKRTGLGLLAGQRTHLGTHFGPHTRSTLQKRLDQLVTYRAGCAGYQNFHCILLSRPSAASEFDTK